jgi:flagellar biosynthetic protein FliP
MTTTTSARTSVHGLRARRIRAAVLGYLGMVVAMFVGMAVLDTGRHLLLPGPPLRGDAEALLMAGEMTVGMAAWMVIRRHPRRGITIMSGAMVLPFLALLPFFWSGLLSAGALMGLGHLAMFGTMALALPFAHRAGPHHAAAVAR